MKNATYGVLNVVAHPHPKGTYRRLFLLASKGDSVNFRGDQYARISPISESSNDVFTGRVAIWTEIDQGAKTIQTRTLIEAALADTSIEIPDDIGFNSKVFSFAFRESQHLMFIELNNEENKSVSIGSVRKIIQQLFDAVKPEDIDEISVFVASQRNAIEQILSLDSLTKIEIVLDMPNPDDLTEEKRVLLDELEKMRAKRQKVEIVKARGEMSLELLPRYVAMADLAKDNGHVTANGKVGDERVERSTKDYPREVVIELLPEESSSAGTRRIAENNEEPR